MFGTLPFLDEQTDTFVELKPGQFLVWQPDTLAEIFRSESSMHLDASSTLQPLVGRHSLLFANGESHTAYRKIIGARLRGRALADQHDIIRSETEAALAATRPDAVLNLPGWIRALTLRIISRVLFGHCDDKFLAAFTHLVESAFGTRRRTLVYRYFRPPLTVPSRWRTFLRHREELSRYLSRDALRAAPGSLTSVMLDASLGEDDLTDQILSLLFAGHETTASATTSLLYWLSRDEKVLTEIQAELAATTSDGSVADDVPLLDAACRETLRISPPAMIAGNRVLSEDLTLAGRHFASGTRLTPCIYAAHRQADIYPDPHRFDPGRFTGQRFPTQHYLPFGGGTRRCLGADLASLEMRMIAAAVLRARAVHLHAPDRATFALRGQALCFGPTLPATLAAR